MTTAYKGLFRRDAPDHPLTPTKMSLLLWVAELGILTVPQLAGLSGISPGSVRRHLRDLFDLELVDRIGVPPAALASPDAPNAPALLYGRAPTLYAVSPDGWKVLVETGRIGKGDVRPAPDYGPKNALFLAHEVQVRDVRVWLERCRRHYGHEGVTLWKTDARLGRARPDAVFVYKLNGATLVGLVEVDRGTEKSPARWQEKFQDYAGVWDSEAIYELTGHRRGRVLVIAPNAKRRDGIAATLGECMRHRLIPAERFWLTEHTTLEAADLAASVWHLPEDNAAAPARSGNGPLTGRRALSLTEVISLQGRRSGAQSAAFSSRNPGGPREGFCP